MKKGSTDNFAGIAGFGAVVNGLQNTVLSQ